MQKIIINFNDENKRLDNFLKRYFKNVPSSLIFRAIRKGQIKVNQKKAKIDYHLQYHDEIELFIDLENLDKNDNKLWFLDARQLLKIIYEDSNIIIINKPIGIASQLLDDPKKESIQKSLLKYLYKSNQYQIDTNSNFVPSICNRLDTNTAGLIIAAKNHASLVEMNELIKQHLVTKKYLCLVFGTTIPNQETLVAYHHKDEKQNKVYISEKPKNGFKQIITKYQKLGSDQKYSLLDVELVTGRTHQIRAHLHAIGFPLVGETKYKNKNTDVDTRIKHQALVSYYLKFNVPSSMKQLAYLDQKSFTIKDIWFLDYFAYFKQFIK